MADKVDLHSVVESICWQDRRYKPDAYEFVLEALYFTQKELKKSGHISGKELLEGVREFALQQYGPMARTVFTHWGISKTDDFGNIVFNMIDKKLLSKTEMDTIEDFRDVYEFDTALKPALGDIKL
ncbi:MAG: hypothetical protein PHH68_06130 [Candidatus Omnitrophica bacterium]|jgi:uncharacterized repeat protein (TIGR04138 family)|nr:hypothetical protein [Candidatus Omnitrophota bacterium]MDD5079886.1 hypothetical protein [Candidatus Omnitrophota bacterium]